MPAGHALAVAFVDPAAQAYPAAQLPLQVDIVSPDVAPKLPARHGPLQLALVKPAEPPYRPALQFVHDVEPATENWPAGHSPLQLDAV